VSDSALLNAVSRLFGLLASLRGITDEIRRRIERFGGQFR
jgi:hypothetical protein